MPYTSDNMGLQRNRKKYPLRHNTKTVTIIPRQLIDKQNRDLGHLEAALADSQAELEAGKVLMLLIEAVKCWYC